MRRRAESTFKAVYYSGETNFMSPNVVRYGFAGKYCYELSVGDSIFRDNEKIWGVTIIDSKRKIKMYDLSKCFETEIAAEKYIDSLKGK